MKVLAVVTALVVGGIVAAIAAPASADTSGGLSAPLRSGGPAASKDRYIVVLRSRAGITAGLAATNTAIQQTATRAGGRILARYSHVLAGFAATLPDAALNAVRADPAVAYVERDSKISGGGLAPRVLGSGLGRTVDAVEPNPPSWGLDRIDQRSLPLDNSYSYDSTGTGVTVFDVDSGIRATHTDFGGRAQGVLDTVGDGNGTNDCHGHGTHTAGTIGGSTYGVAKNVSIKAVRVLQCDNSGWSSDLIEGMDFIAANHPARSVANFSLQGYGTSTSEAAEHLIDSGVQAVFIANNFNTDACTNNPRSSRGIVVAAVDITDTRASFSSFGSCVDVFAPGADITSAGIADDNAVAPGWFGTSMAAPHVTGWVARYLEEFPTSTMAQTKAALIAAATTGVVIDPQGSPNRLLFADPTGPDTAPPSRPGRPASSNTTATSTKLSWSRSTDNVGVTGYDVYLKRDTGDVVVASVTGASATITGLARSTTYTFYVKARDAAANISAASRTRTVTTRSS